MRLLITGGLGLIGSEVAEAAIAAGHEVCLCDDGRAPVARRVQGAERYACSIEYLQPPPGREFDTVIHCAAPVGPVGILGVNVLREMTSATQAAIDLARDMYARLVVLSSSEVYGTTDPGGSLVIPDAWSHRTEYAVGKVATEQMARRHHAETGLPTCIVRPWNITGPRQAASKGFVFPRMAAQAVAGEPITVYAPGDQRRAFMAVSDFAACIIDLLGNPGHSAWDATPIDAANPDNETSMRSLAEWFASHPLSATREVRVIDPTTEHGPTFREAAAGSKLPMASPRLTGWTPLPVMVARAMEAAVNHAATLAAA